LDWNGILAHKKKKEIYTVYIIITTTTTTTTAPMGLLFDNGSILTLLR